MIITERAKLVDEIKLASNKLELEASESWKNAVRKKEFYHFRKDINLQKYIIDVNCADMIIQLENKKIQTNGMARKTLSEVITLINELDEKLSSVPDKVKAPADMLLYNQERMNEFMSSVGIGVEDHQNRNVTTISESQEILMKLKSAFNTVLDEIPHKKGGPNIVSDSIDIVRLFCWVFRHGKGEDFDSPNKIGEKNVYGNTRGKEVLNFVEDMVALSKEINPDSSFCNLKRSTIAEKIRILKKESKIS